MLENIHENIMIFHANFMDPLSSSACWSLSLSLVDLIANRQLVSSANIKGIAEWIQWGRSFIKMTNKRGPRTLPCGTPDNTLQRAELDAPILTHWERCFK